MGQKQRVLRLSRKLMGEKALYNFDVVVCLENNFMYLLWKEICYVIKEYKWKPLNTYLSLLLQFYWILVT